MSSEAPRTDPAIFRRDPRARARRARVPTILQIEATECGAACLGMVLAHHGRWVPLEQLRLDCGVSRDGSNAANIARAARRHGMLAQGFRHEPRDLAGLRLPAILFWNFNHFVVLEALDTARGHAWINDPAGGPRRITLAELDAAFTGVALALRPGAEFRREGRPPSLVAPLLRRLAPDRAAVAFLVAAGLALVLPGLALPAFTQVFVDRVLAQADGEWLVPLVIGLGLTALIRLLLTWLQQVQLARLELKLAGAGSAGFLSHLLRLPVAFFGQRHAGELAFRMGGNTRVAQVLAGQFAANAIGVASMAFFAAIMLLYDPLMTAVAIGAAALNVVALVAMGRHRRESSQRLLREQGALMAVSISGVWLLESLKAGGSEGEFFRRWAGVQARYLGAMQELQLSSTLLNCVPPLLGALGMAAVLGIGAGRVAEGTLTLGGVLAFQSLMASFAQPVEGLVRLAATLQTLRADLAKLDDVAACPAAPEPPPLAPGAPPPAGLVELRGVTFGYGILDRPLLEGFDLTLLPGSRVALVGGSGSGKSTVARIVAGLLPVWSGEVRLDGVALAAMPAERLAATVAAVDQEIMLFEGTIRENLSLWDGTVPEEDLIAALRDAALLDMVDARPGRLEAAVEEGGRNFSGGQRQRLEIARALASNPAVLILDEATSALDPLVEKEIDMRLRRRGCTTLIVAHRLSTIRDCDEIIVMDRGRIVQRGTHEALMASPGAYRRLVTTE